MRELLNYVKIQYGVIHFLILINKNIMKTKTQIRIEEIEKVIMRAHEKPLRCKDQVISHLHLMIETLEEQERKFEELFS